MIADLGRLILLALLLPLGLILIGPFLILAVLRGYQPLGPITLDASRYSPGGRAGALLLGLLLWLLVWGGLAWFVFYAFSLSTATTASIPSEPVSVPVDEVATPIPLPPTATPTRITESTPESPTAPPIVSVETPTSPPVTLTPTPLELTATVTPTDTPTLQPDSTSTLTPTLSPKTPAGQLEATQTPASGQTNPASTATVSAGATLTLSDRQAVVAVVEVGNDLLRETITLANESNMQKMETVWRGLALQVAQNFATDLYQRYAKPLEVEFEYIKPPIVEQQNSDDEVVVSSREKWTYGGPTKIDREEAFEFIYTLNREAGEWVIIRYTYRNLPVPIPTSTSEKQP